jgi:hypothetical protein
MVFKECAISLRPLCEMAQFLHERTEAEITRRLMFAIERTMSDFIPTVLMHYSWHSACGRIYFLLIS